MKRKEKRFPLQSRISFKKARQQIIVKEPLINSAAQLAMPFSAMLLLQIFRFTSSKPSKSARVPDEKIIRQLTTSFNQRFLKYAV